MSTNEFGDLLQGCGVPEGDDDIEILEVVGMDEDAVAPDGPDLGAGGADGGPAVADEDELVLAFDDEPDPAAAIDPANDDRLDRLRAEFDNYRKRVERDREVYHREAVAALAERLLPVLDNFERALCSPSNDESDGFRDGVKLIYRQLIDELRREGLEPIDAVGTPFDPARHEAVSTDISGENPPNIVLEEFQRGYMLQGTLLRPSKVRVTVDPAVAAREGVKDEGA